jgi:hypothetical protein
MSAFRAVRGFVLMTVIVCGLLTAAWSGLKDMPWVHDRDRGDVIWINTGRG